VLEFRGAHSQIEHAVRGERQTRVGNMAAGRDRIDHRQRHPLPGQPSCGRFFPTIGQ
jgi:hypothetical protein